MKRDSDIDENTSRIELLEKASASDSQKFISLNKTIAELEKDGKEKDEKIEKLERHLNTLQTDMDYLPKVYRLEERK